MAVDHATFDAALTDFLADLDAGLAAIQAKLAICAVSAVRSTVAPAPADAKTKFDAAVAADTAPPAAPAP